MRAAAYSLLLLTALSLLASLSIATSLYDASDPILELDVDTFSSSVYNQKRAFFVEFYSSWCGACIAYAPTYKQFAKHVQSWSPIVQVTVVNCAEDKNMPLCREHKIAAFPTVKYFKYNSKNAEDAVNFEGDKHNLPLLPLKVADYVYKNWKDERPPEWPSFDHIAESTTLQDVWNTAPAAHIVAVYGQEEEGGVGAALTINYFGDKRVRSAVANPATSQLITQAGGGGNHKLFLFDKASQKPVFISPDTISFLEAQEKVAEFLQQALGSYLNEQQQQKPPRAHPRDPKFRMNAEIEEVKQKIDQLPAPVNAERKYDEAVWNDLSQYSTQLVDLESALAYMLTREVPRRERIVLGDLEALKRWIHVLSKYAPGRAPTRRLLYRLDEWLKPLDSVTAEEWLSKIYRLQLELGNPLPTEITWLACKGSKPNLRGYTCGLWTLAHAVSVEAYNLEKNNGQFDAARDLLNPFRYFIVRFLSCGECAQNFDNEAVKGRIDAARTAEDAVLWLWRTHNRVNKRLEGAPAEDPKHPKRLFPPRNICRDCVRKDGEFDEPNVLQHLVTYYGTIQNDAVVADPQYTVQTFSDGKLMAAEKHHFNARQPVNGAERVDALEEVEERVKAQMDGAPERSGRRIESFREGLLGGESPRARSYFHWNVIFLAVIAFLVIVVYCKYRRNRSKFWKTFYYSDDFKLPWRSDSPKKQYQV